MNMFKRKENHYVLCGGITMGKPVRALNTYIWEQNEIHRFNSLEDARNWCLLPDQTKRRIIYKIVKEVEQWEPETKYKKTLDNTQR